MVKAMITSDGLAQSSIRLNDARAVLMAASLLLVCRLPHSHPAPHAPVAAAVLLLQQQVVLLLFADPLFRPPRTHTIVG